MFNLFKPEGHHIQTNIHTHLGNCHLNIYQRSMTGVLRTLLGSSPYDCIRALKGAAQYASMTAVP